MCWRATCFIGFIWIATACWANDETSSGALPEVSVCELENHPRTYDGKLVQVRGRIYFGKFDFVIERGCKPHASTRVWLDLGGDVVSPAQYWGIADFLSKEKGKNVRVRRTVIPLVHNAALHQFVNDVGATRFQKPNGDGCGSECLYTRSPQP